MTYYQSTQIHIHICYVNLRPSFLFGSLSQLGSQDCFFCSQAGFKFDIIESTLLDSIRKFKELN